MQRFIKTGLYCIKAGLVSKLEVLYQNRMYQCCKGYIKMKCINAAGVVSKLELCQSCRGCIKVAGVVSKLQGLYQSCRGGIKAAGVVSTLEFYQSCRGCIQAGVVSKLQGW